ncbi:MAG: CBS domain-containing protein, partial [Peptococcaceae bacterium]|nr:CBS domain-containing protein [Peptococcaceae bacterium]
MTVAESLSNVSIEDVMITDVKYLTEKTTIGEAVKKFSEYRVGGFPVVDDQNNVVAYLSDGDIIHYIIYRAGAKGIVFFKSWSDMDVEALEKAANAISDESVMNCATRNVRAAEYDENLREVAQFMDRKKLKNMPVVRDGKLIGVVS